MAQQKTVLSSKGGRPRRRWWLWLLPIVLLALAGWGTSVRLRAPLPLLRPQQLQTASPTGSSVPLSWSATGQAALGAKGYGVLAIHNAQKPVPTASVAKLITALAVLQRKPLQPGQQGPLLTLGQTDVDLYNQYVAQDGSVTAVADGEQISEYQALQSMLLPSSNNMADSTAIWAFGSLDAYTAYANKQLAVWGLNHTHVGSDASGFSPTTTSTASDLVKLGNLVAANPVLAGITSQTGADVPVAGTIHSVNWLLGSNGINGLKTGNSDAAGGAYLFSAAYPVPGGPTVTIIGAVLGAPNLYQAMSGASTLLSSAQKAFTMSPGLANGQAVGLYAVPWDKSVTAVTATAVPALAWQGKVFDQLKVTLRTISAPQAKGARVGSAGFGSQSSNIVLSQPIPAPSWWWRLWH